MRTKNLKISFFLFSVLFVSGIFSIGYLVERTNHFLLFLSFGIAFTIYLFGVLKYFKIIPFKWLLWVVLLARFVLLFQTPNLSDDYYRFIWDGQLTVNNINPFEFTPNELQEKISIDSIGLNHEIYSGLNSKAYKSCYPPIHQAVFWVAAKISSNNIKANIIALRIIIILFDLGLLFLLVYFFSLLKIPVNTVFVYALNPLVVVELTGNLHFEGIMLFFICLSLILLYKKKWFWSSLALGCAISTKLIPLIFLPFVFFYLGYKKGFIYGIVTILTVFITFIPFINIQMMEGIASSIDLYFQKFEFNASIYYLVRTVGYWVKGYNIIQTAGWVLSLITLIIIIYLAIKQKQNDLKLLLFNMLMAISIYYLFSTTVHPWYIINILMLGTLTQLKYPVYWTGLVFLSYWAYKETGVEENYWIIILEYSILIWFILKESKNLKVVFSRSAHQTVNK